VVVTVTVMWSLAMVRRIERVEIDAPIAHHETHLALARQFGHFFSPSLDRKHSTSQMTRSVRASEKPPTEERHEQATWQH
jgi:hypothetical protein